jgi:hypothetical protein
MSRIPVIAYNWYRPDPRAKAKPDSAPPGPRGIERLRLLLARDERRRARRGIWPPPITLPNGPPAP